MSVAARYIVISTVLFALMQVCIKLVPNIPTAEAVLWRAAVAFVICFAMIRQKKINPFGSKAMRPWLILRGIVGTISLYLFFFSIQHMPLAAAVTLQYLSPILTVIIAAIVFREQGTLWQWLCLLISFGGVALMQSADDAVPMMMALACIGSAVFSSMAYNVIRKIGMAEDPLVIVFYFPIVTVITVGPFAISEWVWPTATESLFLILSGVFVHFAQTYMTMGYQREKAANIVNYKYLGAVYALLIGFFFFDESFSIVALIGMVLVIAGSVTSGYITRAAGLRKAAPAETR